MKNKAKSRTNNDAELFDLHKVPDSAIIEDLRKNISILEVEQGKLNAYILELEDKIQKQADSFAKEISSIQKKHIIELRECKELNDNISKEERKELKKELVYNSMLSNLKSQNTKLSNKLKISRTSNNELHSIIAKLKNQIET